MADDDKGISRRMLLRLGWGGAAVLALGGLGVGLQTTVFREPRKKLKKLSAVEFSVLAAMVDRLHPGADGLPSGWELHVPERLDEKLWTLHPADAHDVKTALRFIENAIAGALLDGRLRPFTRLDAAGQDEALECWRTSRLDTRRTAFKALKGLAGVIYWSDPRTYAFVGYPGPPNYGNVRPG